MSFTKPACAKQWGCKSADGVQVRNSIPFQRAGELPLPESQGHRPAGPLGSQHPAMARCCASASCSILPQAHNSAPPFAVLAPSQAHFRHGAGPIPRRPSPAGPSFSALPGRPTLWHRFPGFPPILPPPPSLAELVALIGEELVVAHHHVVARVLAKPHIRVPLLLYVVLWYVRRRRHLPHLHACAKTRKASEELFRILANFIL